MCTALFCYTCIYIYSLLNSCGYWTLNKYYYYYYRTSLPVLSLLYRSQVNVIYVFTEAYCIKLETIEHPNTIPHTDLC